MLKPQPDGSASGTGIWSQVKGWPLARRRIMPRPLFRERTEPSEPSTSYSQFPARNGEADCPARERDLECGERVLVETVVLDLEVSQLKLAAHGLDGRIPQKVREGVNRVDVAVHQGGPGMVYSCHGLADVPALDHRPELVVERVEPPHHAGVEDGAVLRARGEHLVRRPHGAGHRLFHEEHGHARIGGVYGYLGVRVFAEVGRRRAVSRLCKPVAVVQTATRSGRSWSIISM